jgi:hypothetical protein
MPQLDARQGPMPVYRIDHQRLYLDVVIIPQAAVGQRCIIRTRVDGTVAGVDDAPAAFGADFADCRARVRHLMSGTAREWRLVEAIRRGHGADLYRLEKSVVARISTHAGRFPVAIL